MFTFNRTAADKMYYDLYVNLRTCIKTMYAFIGQRLKFTKPLFIFYTANISNMERTCKTNLFRPSSYVPENIYIYLARTPEIGQGLGRILSCGARKPEQT